ncbi:hypothetical protein PR048_031928 [Dryococelus australis]|uniref:DNA repair protein REV1 n=1 Tax=Dryococelus australis TaxID=614101 RepID=A0ABQ9G6N5_9NEOP|nr:hypothetical protein PR048_031928 [Dryococelus australis]
MGGYMAAKKYKLEQQFSEDAAQEAIRGKIFTGVAIFVNGYTRPTAEELKQIMLQHGGTYHQYKSQVTTHVIASNLPDSKVRQLKEQSKVVRPEWVTDSLAAGRLLDYRKYLLCPLQPRGQAQLNFPSARRYVSDFTAASHSHSGEFEVVQNAIQYFLWPTYFLQHFGVLQSDTVGKLLKKRSQNTEIVYGWKEHLKSSSVIPIKSHMIQPAQEPARLASDDNFLSEFYSNSRLHHISTMGAAFKQYVGRLRSANSGHFPGLDRLRARKSCSDDDLLSGCTAICQYPDAISKALKIVVLPVSRSIWVRSMAGGAIGVVMHVDMDCFFVSVGLRARPHLRGLPVAVTHARGNPSAHSSSSSRKQEYDCYRQRLEKKLGEAAAARPSRIDGLDEGSSMSEVASCSYEARQAGIKNGMFLGAALKLCPNLRTIPYDFEAYQQVSYSLYDTVAEYTLDIEAVSCDEMFVDCTELLHQAGVAPLEFATVLRGEIEERTGCTASTGFGGNALLARLATRRAKPDGQFVLATSEVERFMEDIEVSDLPDVGHRIANPFACDITCQTVQNNDVLSQSYEEDIKVGPLTGEHIYQVEGRVCDSAFSTYNETMQRASSALIRFGLRFEDNSLVVHLDASYMVYDTIKLQHRVKSVRSGRRVVCLQVVVISPSIPSSSKKYGAYGICYEFHYFSNLQQHSVKVHTKSATFYQTINDGLLRELNLLPDFLMNIALKMGTLSPSVEGKSFNILSKGCGILPKTLDCTYATFGIIADVMHTGGMHIAPVLVETEHAVVKILVLGTDNIRLTEFDILALPEGHSIERIITQHHCQRDTNFKFSIYIYWYFVDFFETSSGYFGHRKTKMGVFCLSTCLNPGGTVAENLCSVWLSLSLKYELVTKLQFTLMTFTGNMFTGKVDLCSLLAPYIVPCIFAFAKVSVVLKAMCSISAFFHFVLLKTCSNRSLNSFFGGPDNNTLSYETRKKSDNSI